MIRLAATTILMVLFTTQWSSAQRVSREERQAATFHQKYYTALKEYQLGNYDNAKEKLEECLEINDNDPGVYHLFAKIAEAEEQFPEWINQAEKAYERNKAEYHLMQHLLEGYERNRAFDKCIALLVSYSKDNELDDHTSVKLKKQQAYYHLRNGAINKAIDEYNALLKSYGERADFLRELNTLYQYNEDNAGQIQVLQRLMLVEPTDENHAIELARLYFETDQHTKATEVLQDVAQNGKTHSGLAALLLGKNAYATGEETTAYRYFNQAVQSPNLQVGEAIGVFRNLWLGKGQLPSEALSVVVKLAENNPYHANANQFAAQICASQNQWQQAQAFYGNAYSTNANDYDILSDYLNALYQAGAVDKLVEMGEEATTTFPNQPIVYFYYSLGLSEKAQYDEALTILRMGEDMIIDNAMLLEEFWLAEGEMLYKKGDKKSSFAKFDALLEKAPNNLTALNNYAWYLSLEKQWLDKAAKMAKKASTQEPENAVFLDTYGWVLFQQGDYAKAKEMLEKAVEKAPNEAEIHHHLGDAYAKNGKGDKALYHWQKAKQLGLNDPVLDRKIQNRSYE